MKKILLTCIVSALASSPSFAQYEPMAFFENQGQNANQLGIGTLKWLDSNQGVELSTFMNKNERNDYSVGVGVGYLHPVELFELPIYATVSANHYFGSDEGYTPSSQSKLGISYIHRINDNNRLKIGVGAYYDMNDSSVRDNIGYYLNAAITYSPTNDNFIQESIEDSYEETYEEPLFIEEVENETGNMVYTLLFNSNSDRVIKTQRDWFEITAFKKAEFVAHVSCSDTVNKEEISKNRIEKTKWILNKLKWSYDSYDQTINYECSSDSTSKVEVTFSY